MAKRFFAGNWKTTAGGVAAALSGLAMALNAYSTGTPVPWAELVLALGAAVAGLSAVDAGKK